MYYLTLRRHHAASGLAGALAILMRQTNVIWVAFAAGSASLAYLHPRVEGRGMDRWMDGLCDDGAIVKGSRRTDLVYSAL
jgi:hypothetical protein